MLHVDQLDITDKTVGRAELPTMLPIPKGWRTPRATVSAVGRHVRHCSTDERVSWLLGSRWQRDDSLSVSLTQVQCARKLGGDQESSR